MVTMVLVNTAKRAMFGLCFVLCVPLFLNLSRGKLRSTEIFSRRPSVTRRVYRLCLVCEQSIQAVCELFFFLVF